VTVQVHGNLAIFRGGSARQRSAIPGAVGGGASSLTVFQTMVVLNRGGEWKAMGVHTSRPPEPSSGRLK